MKEPAPDQQRIIKNIRSNWLTQKPNPISFTVSALSVLFLIFASYFFWEDAFRSASWMTAIPENVFLSHEYWRLWTALFAHADMGHLLSNSVLFFAFSYMLYGYFGSGVFPVAAILFGGLTNFITLLSLPPSASLLGISGVVYWMGAFWLTLYFLLETRDKLSRRALKAIGVALVLFIPETFHKDISYLNHTMGFALGVGWALAYYLWNRKRFAHAEVIELTHENPTEDEPTSTLSDIAQFH